ncbi:MAG: SURF1 family protein [Austwickia sp.]|nr:SURF1 family protein [Actinomycetota bacterium]MCO5308101.1 SURF1 family protein [Austwickia sp.]
MRTLLTRRWLAAFAAATAFFVVCLFLGRWQWGRHEDRSAYAAAVTRNYDAAPVPLDRVLPAGAPLAEDRLWTRVTATGSYDRGAQQLVRNRPQNVVYGYEVIVPLRLPDGTALLVDRGWVRNAETATTLPDVPPAPSGPVTVTGWLRQGEDSLDRTLPSGQLASINLDEAAQATGTTPRRAYLVLQSEDDGSGTSPPRPAALLPPDTDTGPHFAYALQWWGGSVVGFVITIVYLRRELHDRAVLEGRAQLKERRPKKQRIWDEEDG